MPRRPCYWTRKLELDLVKFVRDREYMWKNTGNTNHHIQQKYKAYAEFAAKLGRGFTARSVRDRWVNIRSTFNHNLRKVDKSRETATSSTEVYVPCWPLWKSMQFLRDIPKREESGNYEVYQPNAADYMDICNSLVKKEAKSDTEEDGPHITEEQTQLEKSDSEDESLLSIRRLGRRTDRPRRKAMHIMTKKNNECTRVLDDLVQAMKPLSSGVGNEKTSYWFFSKHVTERLNSMRPVDAACACKDIQLLLDS